MPVIKGIDASVKVNGKRLDEYTCEDEGDNISKRPFEMTRYIEANSGANFAITVSYNKVAFGKAYSNQALQFDVIVDGTYMDNVVMRADSGTLNGRRVWDTMKQASLEKFKFSDIKICLKVLLKTPEQITDGEVDEDDDSSAMPMGLNTISELGSITVKILRVRSITTSVPKTEAARPLFGSGGAIPEKALKGKALSHQTRFVCAFQRYLAGTDLLRVSITQLLSHLPLQSPASSLINPVHLSRSSYSNTVLAVSSMF